VDSGRTKTSLTDLETKGSREDLVYLPSESLVSSVAIRLAYKDNIHYKAYHYPSLLLITLRISFDIYS